MNSKVKNKSRQASSVKHRAFFVLSLMLATGHWLLVTGEALACSTCYLNVDTPMTRAAAVSVWVLLVIVVALLSGFFAFMIYLGRRSRRFQGT